MKSRRFISAFFGLLCFSFVPLSNAESQSCAVLRFNSDAKQCTEIRASFDTRACGPGRVKKISAQVKCSSGKALLRGQSKEFEYSAELTLNEGAWGSGEWIATQVREREKAAAPRVQAQAALMPKPLVSSEKPVAQTAVEQPAAQVSPVAPPPVAEADPLQGRFFGDIGGWRRRWIGRGVDFGLIYKVDFFRALSPKPGASGSLGNLDFKIFWDGEKNLGWRGWSGFVYGLGNHGDDPSAAIGDFQFTSNIETSVDTFKLYEAWLQYANEGGKLSVLLGIHDLGSEFFSTPTSTLFLNSSFGVGKSLAQTGVNGPSIFPTTSPSIRLLLAPESDWVALLGFFSAHAGNKSKRRGTHFKLGADEGALFITEFARTRGLWGQRGKYGFGFWTYTRTFDHQTATTGSGAVQASNSGLYVLMDQGLSQKWNAFTRLGFASPAVNPVGICWSIGVVGTGVIPSRAEDRFGLGLALASLSDEYRSLKEGEGKSMGASELALEMSYRIEIAGGLALQPDFQWVMRPSGVMSGETGKILSARLEVSL